MIQPSLARALMALAAALAFLPARAADLVIGQVAPYSGPLAPTGSHMREGARLYFDHVNAQGGVNGARIRFVTRDDAYKAAETVRLTRELLAQSRPVALTGVVGTGNIAALVKEKVLDEADVPLVAMRSGATSLVKPPHPMLFHTRASYGAEVQKIVTQLTTTGSTRLAVFYQDDPFGQDGLASAEAAIAAAKANLVAKAGYPRNTTKVEAAVAAIAAAKPQAVIMVSNTAASAEFVKQSRAAGNDAMLFAMSVTDGPQVASLIGKDAAHGLAVVQVVPDPQSRALPVTRELQDLYKQNPPKDIELNHTLLEGFIGAKVLVEGLRRAGPNPSPKRLREALDGLRNFDVGGVVIDFSPANHSGSRYVDITILNREGRLLR